jgi:hypothetical protein
VAAVPSGPNWTPPPTIPIKKSHTKYEIHVYTLKMEAVGSSEMLAYNPIYQTTRRNVTDDRNLKRRYVSRSTIFT